MNRRFVALLDVDGVLNPLGGRPPNQDGWESWTVTGHDGSYRVLTNTGHGRMLLDWAEKVDADLVWATSWKDLANTEIAPRVGLPQLPVVDVDAGPEVAYVNPKTPGVAEWLKADGRPGVWFDDELSRVDNAYLKEALEVPFRLVHVGKRHGLSVRHLVQAERWLTELPTT